ERGERELQSGLADDVVRRRRQRWPRRPPQDEAGAVLTLEQEGEVRPAALTDSLCAHHTGAKAVLVEERLHDLEHHEWRADVHGLWANASISFGTSPGAQDSASTPVEIPARPNSASRSRCASTSPSRKISRTRLSGTSSTARCRSPAFHASTSRSSS